MLHSSESSADAGQDAGGHDFQRRVLHVGGCRHFYRGASVREILSSRHGEPLTVFGRGRGSLWLFLIAHGQGVRWYLL